jgi:hypothetical protein
MTASSSGESFANLISSIIASRARSTIAVAEDGFTVQGPAILEPAGFQALALVARSAS